MALGSLIKKNLKLLIRAKSSSLIVVLGPLLVIFLVGVAFDNANTYALQLGVYSTSYSELSESFIEALKAQNFDVQKLASEELCITKIKEGDIHTCIIFPPNMEIANEAANELVFHVDYSRINLVWMVVDAISAQIHERSSEITQSLAEVLLQKLDETRVEIYNKNPVVESLKSENQELVNRIGAIREQISTIGSSFDTSSSDITVLQTAVQANADSATDMSSSVTSLEDKIEELEAIIADENISGADAALAEIHQELEELQNTTTSNTSWSAISDLVGSVASSIATASEARSVADTDASAVALTLGDAQTKIEAVQLALQKIDASIAGIEVTRASTIASPITTTIKPVSPNKTHLNYLFPSLLIMVIMFISIILSSTLVIMEKTSPAYFRNLITPVRNITFIFGTYLTNMIITALQVFIIFAISIYFFNTQLLLPNLWITILILILAASMFTFIGMAIGYFFNSEETSTLAAISTSSILLLLSNVIIPIESMPAYLIEAVRYNPFVISESLIKRSILFSLPIKELAYDLYFVIGYAILFFILIIIITTLSRRQTFHRLGYNLRKRFKKTKSQQKKKGK